MVKMKARLIKTGNQYLLRDLKGEVLAITNGTTKGRMLSLKNCQAIERGYDLENMADLYGAEIKGSVDFKLGANQGFEEGFQKCLELMGDKKFTEDDVRKAMDRVWDWCEDEKDNDCSSMTELRNKHIQSLQQNEWEVEIMMESFNSHVLGTIRPKLDADGCLILKRVS